MRYQMRQKLLSFGDDYKIKDESGNDLYYVDGRVFSIGDKLSFQDMSGNELAHIRQRILALGKTYEIERDGHTTTIHKHLFTLLTCKFSVDVPGPNDLEAKGNLIDMEYEFVDTRGHRIAEVSKRWFRLADTYGIEIASGQDDVLILCCAVVIDLCCHGDKKRR
jgi:uncharacterized protein YxjI